MDLFLLNLHQFLLVLDKSIELFFLPDL